MTTVYPMLVQPRFDERLWGGNRLSTDLGKSTPTDKPIGESWEVYDENIILNGEYVDQTIAHVRKTMGRDMMGRLPVDRPFPLLTKFIDAHEVLSVQVHPNDRFAQELEGQPNGKTECWYVIESDPGSRLTLGFLVDTSPDEFESRVTEGTLDGILRAIEVQSGDVIYIPAGTVHAIGAGILLYELQQTSDVTYRIYDWNRRDAAGKTRELHVDKARRVLNYRRETRGIVRPLHKPGSGRSMLVAGEFFCEELIEAGVIGEMQTRESPIVLCTLNGSVLVRIHNSEPVILERYASLLIPACAESYIVEPASSGQDPVAVLMAYAPRSRLATFNDLRDRGFSHDDIEMFLGQFDPAADLGQHE